MNNDIYFFDTYAVMELVNGNPNYQQFIDAWPVVTKLNLFEMYHGFLRDLNEEKACFLFEKYYKFIMHVDSHVIKKAAELKLRYKQRNLSMTDCIGYCLAKQLGIKFLTGDKEFEDMENVEFMK